MSQALINSIHGEAGMNANPHIPDYWSPEQALAVYELLDALREGQLAFFVAINEIAQSVEEDVTRFELDRERFLDMLRRVQDDVQSEAETG